MAGNAFVIGERGQRIFRPVAGVLQIDEIDRRSRAVERRAAVITVGSTVLDFGRNAADFERLRRQCGESALQPRVHRIVAVVQPLDQLGARCVGIGVKLFGHDVQRREPLADGPLGHSRLFQHGVEFGGEARHFAQADRMHLIGREARRRRLFECGGIDRRTVLYAPRAVARRGGCTQRGHGRDLPVECGVDLVRDDLFGTCRPVAGDRLGRGARRDRPDQPARRRRLTAQLGHLPERQIDRPGRRKIAARGFGFLLGGLLVEDARERFEPRQIRLGVRRSVDRVRGVEEIGRAEIGTALLEDTVGALDPRDAEALGGDGLRFEQIDNDFAVELRR